MIFNLLTKKQKTAYLKDDTKCPYCQSPKIKVDSVQRDGSDRHHLTRCNICYDCRREWIESFKLIEVDDGEILCDDCDRPLQNNDVVEVARWIFHHANCPKKGTP